MPAQPLSQIIQDRKDHLGLTTNQLAIAAGLHKTTLYRILAGVTKDPRAVTLRKLARALRLSITDLTDQIEPEALQEHFEIDHPLADILIEQLHALSEGLQLAGAMAAVSAMLDVEAGLGERKELPSTVNELLRRESQPSSTELQGLLRSLFQRIPRLLQRTAVREAVRAMIDVQLRFGEPPSAGTYRVAADSRLLPTPSFLVKRQKRIWRDKRTGQGTN